MSVRLLNVCTPVECLYVCLMSVRLLNVWGLIGSVGGDCYVVQ